MGLNSQLPDVYHNEIMIRYTQEYLANAGATVFMTRERWFGTSDEQILDDQSANCIKTGGWTSYGVGFLGYHSYVFGNLNAETAVAAFVTTLAADGYYPVYIRGLGDGQNRASRTLIRIFHSGGTTTLYMNQNMYSRQWMYAGRYYFTKTGFRVEVSNKLDFAVDAGRYVIVDAVRVGCGSLGGYPRFHYGTSSFLTYMNYTVSTSSATAMADFSKQMIQGDLETANWQNWALFYLVSTATSDSATRGTQDFSYSNGRTSSYTGITSTAIYNSSLQAASDSFRDVIHAAAVSTGLLDKANNLHQWAPLDSSSRMPTMMAIPYYASNNVDMLLAQSEAGRENLGRAYYKGIAKYFSSTATIIPLPVNYLHTINQGGNVVRVCWRQPDDTQESTDAATAFKIYRSTDGRGWDDGVIVAAFTYLNSLCYDVTSLTVGQVYFFKVAGLNAGGEALTKWTAAARVTDPAVGVTRPPIVIVDCFVEGFVHTSTNIEGRYTREYVVEHALSIAGAGYSFDSASADIFSESQWVTNNLAAYKAVVWASGDTAANINVFPAVAQTAINSWIAGASSASPRSLFVSGSNVAAGLSAAGSTSLTFLNSQLKSTFVNANANTFVVRPNAGFTMSGTVAFNSIVALGNPYAVSSPDQIGTAGTGTAALYYGPSSGTNVAGVSSRSTAGYYASFLLAFPFETINSRDERDKLMASILSTIMFAAPDLPLALPSVSSAASMATRASVASRSSASIATTVSASVASIASAASTASATVASVASTVSASLASASSASIASASSKSIASASSESIASASSESVASASSASIASESSASIASASSESIASASSESIASESSASIASASSASIASESSESIASASSASIASASSESIASASSASIASASSESAASEASEASRASASASVASEASASATQTPQYSCHVECQGGCTGPADTECVSCAHFKFGARCVASCPIDYASKADHVCAPVPNDSLPIGAIAGGAGGGVVLLLLLLLILLLVVRRRRSKPAPNAEAPAPQSTMLFANPLLDHGAEMDGVYDTLNAPGLASGSDLDSEKVTMASQYEAPHHSDEQQENTYDVLGNGGAPAVGAVTYASITSDGN
ncbi:hypothetical protein CAOG_01892 [Capsaspora owczarzaki ATCC 30864]|nr:hypothetical protein CAOG_01892 [Capsaspora owczarzaki ATCC 30864]|eukprot:XP_004364760.1 hypothetical protein CAOG_01892 [Capsaspora owczarzaki ATCC 30864]